MKPALSPARRSERTGALRAQGRFVRGKSLRSDLVRSEPANHGHLRNVLRSLRAESGLTLRDAAKAILGEAERIAKAELVGRAILKARTA